MAAQIIGDVSALIRERKIFNKSETGSNVQKVILIIVN